jgi:hypothetical protein
MDASDAARQQAEQTAADSEASDQALRVQLAAAQQQINQPPQQQSAPPAAAPGGVAPSWSGQMGAPTAPAQPPVNPQFAVFQAQNPGAIGQVIQPLTVDITSIPSFSGESRDVTVEQFWKDFGLANDLVKKLHPQTAHPEDRDPARVPPGVWDHAVLCRARPTSCQPADVDANGCGAVWASKDYSAFLKRLRARSRTPSWCSLAAHPPRRTQEHRPQRPRIFRNASQTPSSRARPLTELR